MTEFKKYNHSQEEKKISDFWIKKKGLFKPKKTKLKKKFFNRNTTPKYYWEITYGARFK